MARRRTSGSTPRTTFASSRYGGTRRASSVESGGRLGRGGRFITRNQRYRDIRSAMGLSSG